jgi:hypothetical protein
MVGERRSHAVGWGELPQSMEASDRWCTSTSDIEETTGACRLGDCNSSTSGAASIRPVAGEGEDRPVWRGDLCAATPRLAQGDTGSA